MDVLLKNNTSEFVPKTNFIEDVLPSLTAKPVSVNIVVQESSNLTPGTVNFVQTKFNEFEAMLPVINHTKDNLIVNKGEIIPSTIIAIEDNVPRLKRRTETVEDSEVTFDVATSELLKEEILKLLNEFSECTARNLEELGCTSLIKMDITTKEATVPQSSKHNRASPVLLVKKKDGSRRLVVDYRRVNNDTFCVHFPLPNVDYGLEDINEATIFATLDLANGHLQIPLTERAKEKTAYITPDETGQFERAMFGLTNAPFYFNKLMEKVSGEYQSKIVIMVLILITFLFLLALGQN